ncbi:hypothetical protein [Ferruginibacter sp.]
MKNTTQAAALFITAIAAIILVVKVHPHLPKTYNEEFKRSMNDTAYRYAASPVELLFK